MVKFLVIRFAGEAEVKLAASVAGRLDREVEGCEIQFLTSSSSVRQLKGNPHLRKVHTDEDFRACLKDLRKEGFDYLIDLQNNLKSARVKLSLKRMDFTVKRSWRGQETELEKRFTDTIRLFVED
jgi:ADP-heptose:LPS heptosyltransferase